MTKVKDGFWKQLGSKVGSNEYLLKAAGGYIGVGNSSGEVVPLNNGTKNENLNADMLDGLHETNLVKFYLSPMEGGAPASSAKSWFENTMPSGAGAIVYNVPGSEKTIIVGKSTGAYGHMLQLNYDDKYLRILRYYGGNWRSDDWEKISAGYADSAGDADKLDGYHANDFATAGHTHYIGNKPASDLSSTYPQGISVGGIYANGYPFQFGSTITAYGSGGYFQIAGQWNSDVTGASNYDFPTEMYIRGRRDSYDVWTTWTRVLTDRNYTNVLDNRYYTETEADNRFVNVTGDTMTGLLTTTSGNHSGIKVGNTYVTAINGELIFQNNSAIRFGGDSWDYDVWAGLKYEHSSKTIYLGLAGNSVFTTNSDQSGGTLNLSGIYNISSTFYNIKVGSIIQHIPATSGWYTIAQVSGYFNYDLYITGDWWSGKPSTVRVNICNINGTTKITQFAGYIGNQCSQIRLGQVNTNVWDVQLYINGQTDTLGDQKCIFTGYGGLIVYNTNTVSSTSYSVTNTLAFGQISGVSLTSDNYTTYTVKKDGTGATGTWGISITGNAGSATKLQTSRKLWSQPFDGTADVNGQIDIIINKQNSSTVVPSSSAIMLGSNGSGHTGYHAGIAFNALRYTPYVNHIHAWIGLGPYTTTAVAECYPLVFATNESTTTGNAPTERMRITPSGNVGIGITNPAYKLEVGGSICGDEIYANRGGSSTKGGISLYYNVDPMTYGIAFRGTGTYGIHGFVTSANDWATYLTMSDNLTRGWIFRRGSTNVASIAGSGDMAIGQHLKFSNEAHISTNRSTDYHYGYTFNLGGNAQSIGMYSGPAGESGGVVISPDGCLIYNSSDCGYNLQVRDKDLGSDLTNIATLTFGIEQSGYYAWSRGGFKKNGSDDSYVLLGGGGHKAESGLSVNYANSAGTATNANNLANIAAGNYFKHGDAVFNSEWSGKYLWTLWDNHLYAADKRLAVTLTGTTSTNFSSLFDGSFESSVSITEAKAVLHIKSTTEGNVWTEGLPYGDFYVVFYNSDAENITGRVYCNYAPQGTGWHDLAITHVGSYIWKLHNGYYQLSDLEITITKPVSSASIDLCQVLHVVERSPSPYYAAVMSKYCDQKTNYSIESAKFVKTGGTSSQFLKADGSIDSNTYSKSNHTHNYAGSSSAGGSANSALTLLYSNKFDTNYGDYAVFQQDYGRSDFPHLGWFNSIKMLHNNSHGYFTEIVTSFTGEDGMWRRVLMGGGQVGWYKMLDSGNYNSYALPISGGTLTGSVTMRGMDTNLVRDIVYAGTSGWARDLITLQVDGISKFSISAFGDYTVGASDNGIYYGYIGCNPYNGLNLRISDTSLTWGDNSILHAGNYNSYAPTLTGTGASGTWSISISGTADSASYASVLLPIRKPTTDTVKYDKPFSYFVGQPTIGTAEGNAYAGSSSNYNLLSFPPDGTVYDSTYANVMTLRLSWDKSKYWHDIFASPNTKFLWHRCVQSGTAYDWCRIVEEATDRTWGINISGNAATATNADILDGYHASNLVKFYLSPMTGGAPADSATSWFVNTMPSGTGAIVYNVPGSEKTIIAGKSTGAYGHMLQLNYEDNYLRILRYCAGKWITSDWEKVSAGYADAAGNADTVDNMHASDFSYNVSSGNYDCNNLPYGTHSATYRFSGSPLNAFPNSSWSNMFVIGAGSDTMTQIGAPYDTDELYFRRGTWDSDGGSIRTNEWKAILHSGNYTSYVNNYYWANVKISTSSNTGTYPTFANMKSTGRVYLDEWIQFNGSSGLYWPNTNGAHLYANTTTSYAALITQGSRGGYCGLQCGPSANYMTVMSTDTHHGLYCENTGTWEFYYNRSNDSVGIRTSSNLGYDINLNGSVGSNSSISGVGFVHTSYNSASYLLTSNGGAVNESKYLKNFGSSNYVTFTVGGDANTYYPVRIHKPADYYPYSFITISRTYYETAPDTWYTSTHKGGLSMCLFWNSSCYWDGNSSGEECFCVRLNETYCNMVAGMDRIIDGTVVWLRGGGATYHIHGMAGTSQGVTVYLESYTDHASRTFSPRTWEQRTPVSVRWPGYANGADYASSAGSVAWDNVTGKPFNWSGQSGQPTWLWGSNDGTNYYVWNPSNFNVNYANSAGSADYADSAESATQATNLTPENTAHYFRDPNNSTWRGGMIWGSAGSESMSFVVANSGTRFQFVGGSDIANWGSSTWQSTNPYLTIYSSGIVTPGSATASGGFIKSGYDNTYVLLAGGGHKLESNLSVSYASSAGSVAWANITEKPFNWSGQSGQPSWLWGSNDGTNYYVWDPSNFSVNYADSAGSAERARYLTCPDTRSSAPAPGDYTATSTGVSFDFKESSVTGLSGYSGVMTFRPYGSAQDWTGGEVHQIAFLSGGGLYHRIGTSSWGSWERILTSANWSSYISIPSVGNGTVTITQAGSTIGSFTMNQSGNTIIALNDTNTDYYPIRSYTSGLQISSYSGSTDCALFVPYATANQAGVVSTETQTFSGQKTFSSIRLRSTDTANFGGYLYFGDGSYAYLAELADDQLTLNASKIFLGIGGRKEYYIDETEFRPVTANSTSSSGIALGSSDYRFTCGYFSDKVYAYKGFYESSDERLKNILNPVKVNLDDLSKLRKVYYLWKDRTEDGIQLGMIAQDVQRLYPELVSVDKETGYLSLAYDKLSVLALEAIDVLYKEHKKLKKHVDELEKLLINNKIY